MNHFDLVISELECDCEITGQGENCHSQNRSDSVSEIKWLAFQLWAFLTSRTGREM